MGQKKTIGQRRGQYSHTAFTQGTDEWGFFLANIFCCTMSRCLSRLTRRRCPDRGAKDVRRLPDDFPTIAGLRRCRSLPRLGDPPVAEHSCRKRTQSCKGPACAIQRLPCFLAVRAPTRFLHLQCKSYYQYFDDLFGRLNLDGGQGQDDDTDEMSCNICGTGMYR